MLNVLIIDGHPAAGRLVGHLLDLYAAALPQGTTVKRINVRDLSFDPVLHDGYTEVQALEPDLEPVTNAIENCDHLVVGFPLWWGAEPAGLKGLVDRVILPGFAFGYRPKSVFWDRLMVGRSADVIVTMDTPPWYLRWVYGDPVMKRWRGQILEFCGFRPVRTFALGPTRRGQAAKNLAGWTRTLERAAATAGTLRRGEKLKRSVSEISLEKALEDRKS